MDSLAYSKSQLETIWQEGHALCWQEIERIHKEQLKLLIEHSIFSELELFVGSTKYERTKNRKSYRNGYYERLIATTLGEIPIKFPRLRYESFQSKFIEKYSRRIQEVDYAVLNCFILGGSVRKTKKICDLFINVQISPSGVSNILKTLDDNAREFHARPIISKYRFLMLDGLWIKVQDKYDKKKVLLFAMGITYDYQKEVIGFLLADGETEEAYLTLINNLLKRGFDADVLELIVNDGAKGLRAALNMALPYTKKQYCVFHKIQGIAQRLNHKENRSKIMNDASFIYEKANSKHEAIKLLQVFINKWKKIEPRVVKYLVMNFDDTLTYFEFPNSVHSLIKTSNHLERYFREIRRRTRPMGNFKNNKSVNRIIYALVYTLNNGEEPNKFTQLS